MALWSCGCVDTRQVDGYVDMWKRGRWDIGTCEKGTRVQADKYAFGYVDNGTSEHVDCGYVDNMTEGQYDRGTI